MTTETKAKAKAKHTEGPWHGGETESLVTSLGRSGWEVGPLGLTVAIMGDGVDSAVQQANARLISATPELLKACQAIVDNWESGDLAAAAKKCSAAIAKATP